MNPEERKMAKILDVPIDIITMPEAISRIEQAVEQKKKLQVITINPEMIMLSGENEEFREIVNNAGLIIPDGSGVILGLRKQGINIPKLAGIELTENCLRKLNANFFLFGGQEETIKSAYENLKKIISSGNISGYRHGFFKEEDEEEIIAEINRLKVDILFVGLGVPKQEKWIFKNMAKINASVFIGVGGSFDVFSGKIKRAPKLMQKLHLEWLYRLYLEPWRWRRMMALPRYVLALYGIRNR